MPSHPLRHARTSRAPRARLSAFFAGIFVAAGLAVSAAPAAGQFAFGVHGVSAADAFGGVYGLGGRVALTLPILPVDFLGTAETFFPDCDDCSLRGLSIDVSLDLLPTPIVRPYVTGGLTFRRFDTGFGEGSEDQSGLNVGAGVNVGLSGLRLFGEGRYELVSAPERQVILRLGVLFGG